MGQINVEVKVMKLPGIQTRPLSATHHHRGTTDDALQYDSRSRDMKWAEKFAKALEASELITIPNRELDVVLSDAPDEEPEADTPPKQVKRNRKKQEITRGVKDLCLDKIIFDKTKSHVNNAAQVILEEFMTRQSGEDDEADKSQTSESLARRGRSGNSMENTAENSSEEAPMHRGNMKETSANRKSAIVVRPESCQMDENLVLETSCIEESARICGLKEPDEGPGVLKISNVGQAHHESPLRPENICRASANEE
ncbi:hypothetical protein BSL78_27934 [Apostichopus japonicus]|uniref:Uncharacterized protein n=1 Tax=Stichopus japonicus TaxID=307972 RepID=A0A2G8JHL7_STIJA|nr:hypothetical protein BSL78_27934 [Apostichopus japonicus]